MLMIFYKARVEKQLSTDYGNKTTPSDRLIEELRQGLERIIATVTNYAAAFEALDGMRGKSYSYAYSIHIMSAAD